MTSGDIIRNRNNLILLLKDSAEDARLAVAQDNPDKVMKLLELVTKITALINALDDLLNDE